jgi:hypothetical protein
LELERQFVAGDKNSPMTRYGILLRYRQAIGRLALAAARARRPFSYRPIASDALEA